MAEISKDKNFFYGINLRSSRICHGFEKFNEASDIKNIMFLPDGGIQVRGGRIVRGTVAEIAHQCDWFVDINNQDHFLIHAGSKIYDDGGVVGTPVLSKGGLTDAAYSRNEKYLNYFWYANGYENLKFDGTSWTNLAVVRPTTGPVVADGGAGALTGQYQYCYVYYYKDVALGYESESRASEISEILVAGKKISVSVVADPSGEATGIRIYRRSSNALDFKKTPLGGGGAVDLPNTTTTYTDETAEEDMGDRGNYLNEGAPVSAVDGSEIKLEGIIQWKDSLWGWKDSILYHTVKGRPGDWLNEESVYKPFNMDPMNNEKIIGVARLENVLCVYTHSKMMQIIGDDEPYAVIDKEWGIGCVAPKSIQACGTWVMWLAKDGVYRFDGYNKPHKVSRKINRDNDGYGRGLLDNTDYDLTLAAGIYVPAIDQYWLSVSQNSGGFNRVTFVYDFRMDSTWSDELNDFVLSPWTIYDIGFSDAKILSNGRIVSTSGTDGNYREENYGVQDDGVDVSAYYETKMSDYGTTTYDKRLCAVSATGRSLGSPITLLTKVQILGFGLVSVEYTMSASGDEWEVDPGDPAYPAGEWGADPGDPTYPSDHWGEDELLALHKQYGQEFTGSHIGFKITMDRDAVFDGLALNYIHVQRYDT